MKRKRQPSKRMQAVQAAHDKFLRGLGIDPTSKPLLRGAVVNPLDASSRSAPSEPRVPLSNDIPGSGTARKPMPHCNLPVAQTYHKGPLMVVTDMQQLEGSKRR